MCCRHKGKLDEPAWCTSTKQAPDLTVPEQAAAQCTRLLCRTRMTCAPLAAGSSALPPLTIPKPKKTQAWALVESEFEEGLVGGKAGNLAKLRGKLPAGVSQRCPALGLSCWTSCRVSCGPMGLLLTSMGTAGSAACQ